MYDTPVSEAEVHTTRTKNILDKIYGGRQKRLGHGKASTAGTESLPIILAHTFYRMKEIAVISLAVIKSEILEFRGIFVIIRITHTTKNMRGMRAMPELFKGDREMNKKLISILAAVVVLLSACGQGTSSQAAQPFEEAQVGSSISESAPDSAAPESIPESAPEPVEAASEGSSSKESAAVFAPESASARILSIAAPKGPTSMGMAQLMSDNAEGGLYHFTLVGSPDELVGGIVKGEYDIAAVPVNLAANLYQKTDGGIKLAALNTLGVLYIVEAGDTIQSVEDLRGQTVYATGQGSTPEFALNYILNANGLTPGQDVTVEYKTEHAELAGLLAAGEANIALLPQPFVTSAMEQNPSLRVALNLTEEWDKAAEGEGQLTMGCLIVQSKLAEEAPEAVDAFLKAYRDSVNFVKDEQNRGTAAQMMEQFDILKAGVAEKALPECNLVFIRGDKMKEAAEGFLKVLYESDPKSVGGELPDGRFYYGAAE